MDYIEREMAILKGRDFLVHRLDDRSLRSVRSSIQDRRDEEERERERGLLTSESSTAFGRAFIDDGDAAAETIGFGDRL